MLIPGRLMLTTALVCLVACLSSPSKADKPETKTTASDHYEKAQNTPAQSSDAKELDKIVCRTEAPVGSRIGTRICMSRRRWIESQKSGQKMVEDINRIGEFFPYLW